MPGRQETKPYTHQHHQAQRYGHVNRTGNYRTGRNDHSGKINFSNFINILIMDINKILSPLTGPKSGHSGDNDNICDILSSKLLGF